MNIKLQFLKRNLKKPKRVSLVLFSWLSVTVANGFSFEAHLELLPVFTLSSGEAEFVDFFQAVDVTITGTVRDQNQEPIPGVTVSVPGTGIGTATDMDGGYSITVPEGATLVFSFIGFESHAVE